MLNTLRLDFVFMNNFELCSKSSGFLNDMVHNFFWLIFFNFLFFCGIFGTVSQMNMHFMNRMVSSCPPLSTFKTFGTCNKRVIHSIYVSYLCSRGWVVNKLTIKSSLNFWIRYIVHASLSIKSYLRGKIDMSTLKFEYFPIFSKKFFNFLT